MAQQPSEDRKIDISSLPRGAIGLKGLPIGRNTRLPSIRSPRDLTLGAPSKRTFLPNIPPRREKKSAVSENKSTPRKEEHLVKSEIKNASSQNDRGRGRGRGKPNIIQTQGSVFAEGVAENTLSRKGRISESYLKSDYAVSSKSMVSLKKELPDDITALNMKMDELFTDDFIDDDDDDGANLHKPTIFPPNPQPKKQETKTEMLESKSASESVANFDQNVAEEMGFDINRVAKFIKKEKGTEVEGMEKPVISTELSEDEITKMLNEEVSQLMLLKFPQCVNVPQKGDDSHSESNNRGQTTANSAVKEDKTPISTCLPSLPEGFVGRLKVFKSGRTRMVFNNLNFELESVDALKSRHEVISLRTKSDDGDLNIVGYVEQKLIFAPDVDSLLLY